MAKSKEDFVTGVMNTLKSHYGDAAKSYWVCADDICPGCQVNKIDEFVFKGERTVSINGFMYRAKGVLIGYFLCGECANTIHAHSVYKKLPLHKSIEDYLIEAYQLHLSQLDA